MARLKRKQPERQLQAAVCEYLSRALPADCWFTAIPGGNRGVTTTPGYVSGTPDILILWDAPGQDITDVYWIELKAPKGRASVEQKLCHSELAKFSAIAVCRSLDDVQETLIGWGIVLKATVGRRAA